MILLDTHVLIWWVIEDPRLSAAARRAIRDAARNSVVYVSTISVMEIATAVRRGRLMLSVPMERWFADVRLLPELQFEPVTSDIALVAGSFDGAMHGDPADRIIAATARILGARLVTADQRFRALSEVATVW